jgi:Spy/CpxP family protein refolding chaperone
MKTLSVASAALVLAVATSLAPAIAQEPKLPDDNAWPGISRPSTAARQMRSQQLRITSTNMVTTIMQGGEAIGSWSGNS